MRVPVRVRNPGAIFQWNVGITYPKKGVGAVLIAVGGVFEWLDRGEISRCSRLADEIELVSSLAHVGNAWLRMLKSLMMLACSFITG